MDGNFNKDFELHQRGNFTSICRDFRRIGWHDTGLECGNVVNNLKIKIWK